MTNHDQCSPGESASAKPPLKHILLFCTACFFFWATLYLYAPILPVYSQSVGADLSMVGAIVAAYAIPQLLFRLPAGILFDIIARKKLLLIVGILMASLGALGLGLAKDPWMLFWARAVAGIGAASWVSFIVYFTAYYPLQDTRRAISILNFILWIALVAASYSGGLIAQAFSYSYAFFGAVALGVIALIVLLFTGEPVMIARKERFSIGNFIPVATYPPLLIVSLIGVLSLFGDWAGLFGFVPVYANSIGASSADLGMLSMLSLAASAVASLAVIRVARLWGSSFTILLGSILQGVTMLVVPFIHSVSLLTAVMFINGLGRGLLGTILMTMSIQTISLKQRATAMGIFQAAYALGMVAGPLASGFVAKGFGLSFVFYQAALCFVATAILAYLPRIRHMRVQ